MRGIVMKESFLQYADLASGGLKKFHKTSERFSKESNQYKLIKSLIPQALSNTEIIDESKYLIDGSAGAGGWALIPWVAIMDLRVTKSATKGFYIVYLFKNDFSGLYISLNQGWTEFEESRKAEGLSPKEIRTKLKYLSEYWTHEITSDKSRFNSNPIQLQVEGSSNRLAKGYENGHILGKFYDFKDLPSSEELLLDMRELLGIYNELVGKLGENYLLTVQKILNNEIDYSLPVEENIISIDFDTANIEEIFYSDISYRPKRNNFSGNNIDFEVKNKKNKKLGDSGEELVMKFEQNRLRTLGLPKNYAPEWHSRTQGDGLGYDILSYNAEMEKIYIEVKSTSADENTHFFISNRELERSRVEGDNYYLYRLSNLRKNSNVKLEVYNGPLDEQKFDISPNSYVTIAKE